MKKRVLSMATMLCLLLALFPVTAFADDFVPYDRSNIHGIEDGKTYCGDTYFTVDIPAEHLGAVWYRVKGASSSIFLKPDEQGRYKLKAGLGYILLVVPVTTEGTAFGGNILSQVTINADHIKRDHDHLCDVCGERITECSDTTPKDHKCDICGVTLSDHSGGTATCKERAVCEYCSEPYGGFGAHSCTVEDRNAAGALKTAGDCRNEAIYYKSCSVCGAVSTDDANTFTGDKDPTSHTGTPGEWQKDERAHWKVYSGCRHEAIRAAHSYTKGVCECGAVQHTVTFEANSGTVGTAATSTDHNGKLTSLPTPTRSACRFDGWFTAQNGGMEITTETTFTENTTAYARWTLNTYTVTYAAGADGTGTVTAGSKTHGTNFTLSRTAFTRTGYTQTGWATTDGGAKVYDLGGSYTANVAVTLYPVWTQNSSGGFSTPTYSITAHTAANGSVKVSHRYAERGDTVTVTVTPDAGYVLETLTVLDKNGNAIELKDLGNSKYSFKMPAGKVEVKATFMDDNTILNFFTDVTADKYYCDAVLWAAKNGITGGTSATTFGPHEFCTRAQLVTFLWRAAGCPVVDYAMSFTDVGDSYYTEAVRWAASLGIVGGYGNGLFGTNDTITREQLVTILYRFAVAMGYDVSVGEDTNILSYNDVFDVSEYAVSAFQWAVGAGIVQGANGNLMPKASCTRTQIVTMLYRLLGE